MKYITDVVIAGAGISGLLIASEISKCFKTVILEAHSSSDIHKFWITDEFSLKCNPEFNHLIDSVITSMDIIDAYRNRHTIKGNSLLWKSEELINFLKQKLILNKGEVYYNHRFCGYRNNGTAIDVYANEKTFRARLLIDCMGYNSPLILSKSMVKIHGYYTIHGASLKLKKNIRPICLSNVIISNKPSYFEVFPDSNNNAHAIIISPTRKVKTMVTQINDFNFIIEKSHYASYFENNSANRILTGIIPVGVVKTTALDNIFFYGESAHSNPAATGTLLTRMLLNYKNTAEFLKKQLNSNLITAKSLRQAPPSISNFNRKIQLIVYEKLLSANSDDFSKYVKQLSNVSDEIVHKFVYGNLDYRDIFTSKRIGKLLSKKLPTLTNSLFELLFR